MDFVTDELGVRIQQDFQRGMIADVFHKSNIPYFPVDIDATAKSYLEDAIAKKIKSRDNLVKSLDRLSKQKDGTMEEEYVIALGQSLQSEIAEHQHEVNYSIRESWMAMGILNHAREVKGKEEMT